MIRKKKIVMTSILILICLTATGIGAMAWRYLPPPIWLRRHPLNHRTCHIGVIFPTSDRREEIIIDYAEEDINAYCDKLGYNVRFDFLVQDADRSVEGHLEKIQQFDDLRVNLIVGGAWSSQAYGSLDYINENEMLLISPSSTSPLISIPEDNLFRLAQDDTFQPKGIAEMLYSWGINAIIIIENRDAYGNFLYDALEQEYNGDIIGRIKYPGDTTDFSEYLETAEEIANENIDEYGSEHVAIQLISLGETADIIEAAQNYENIYNLYWFGCDSTVCFGERMLNEVPDQAEKLKIFSVYPHSATSSKWDALSDRFSDETGQELMFYNANWYDACWIYTKAVLEAATWDTNAVKSILPDIANDYFGVTGWCHLNDAGDRYPIDFDIVGCGKDDTGEVHWIKYGIYELLTEQVTWFTDVLGFNPPGPTPEGPIRIAVIATSEPGTEYETLVRFAEEEINEYCEDEDLDLEFEFIHVNAEGSPGYHRYWVEYFDKVGVNLIIGGGWSSMAGFSLDYINENEMLLFSPSSTSPLLSIPDDNLFRLTVDDNDQVNVISQMLLDKGKTSVIFIQASDLWFDLLYEEFGDVYTGTVLEHIRYNSGGSGEELEEVLERAEEIYNDAVAEVDPNTIGVVFASWNPQPLIALTSGYVGIYGLEWYTDYGTYTPEIIDESPDEAAQIKLYNPQHFIPESQKKDELRTRYYDETGEEIDTHVEYFILNIYDIARIYGLSVIDVETDETEQVKAVLPSIAVEYEGVTGYCTLNEYGDRLSVDYYIWGYSYDEYGEVQRYKYGFYDDDTGIIEWFEEPQ